MSPMRAAIVLTGLVLLAFAGAASAGDSMLPVLLKDRYGLAAPGEPGAPPTQGAQSLPPPANVTPMTVGVALAMAAFLTLGTLWWLGRNERPA